MIISNPVTEPAQSVTLTSSRVLCDQRYAQIVSVFRRWHPNTVIIGVGEAVDRFLRRIHPHLIRPVAQWTPAHSGTWPRTAFRTLIIRNIDGLSTSQQTDLTTLAANVQIISTTKAPLFPAVENGVFDERLYYVLNVIVLEVCAPETI